MCTSSRTSTATRTELVPHITVLQLCANTENFCCRREPSVPYSKVHENAARRDAVIESPDPSSSFRHSLDVLPLSRRALPKVHVSKSALAPGLLKDTGGLPRVLAGWPEEPFSDAGAATLSPSPPYLSPVQPNACTLDFPSHCAAPDCTHAVPLEAHCGAESTETSTRSVAVACQGDVALYTSDGSRSEGATEGDCCQNQKGALRNEELSQTALSSCELQVTPLTDIVTTDSSSTTAVEKTLCTLEPGIQKQNSLDASCGSENLRKVGSTSSISRP